MIVWGGSDDNDFYSQTGESYNPSTNSWFNLNLQGAPSGRIQHSAIWTGLNMIIWGGSNNGININTGAQYNPDTDSWTEVTTNGISVKGRVSTVWTGDEMIIWGGETYGEGGKFNPITNSWTLIQNRGNVPEARFEHSTVWTGNEMVIWGGESRYGGDLNTGAKYDPITDNWESTSIINAPSKRKYQSKIWTGTEMIIWGGQTVSGLYLNTGARYNPIVDSWIPTSVNPQEFGKFNHTAVWTGTEMIIWGGNFNNTSEGAKYNPSTDSWIDMSTVNAPEGRSNHTAIWAGSEMIVWAGIKEFSPFYLNSGGMYNPDTNSWSEISRDNAPSERYKHTALWSGTEMIIWGGFKNSHGFNTGGIYNPANDSWSSINTLNAPSGRSRHTAVWNGHEMLIWGGVTNASFDSNTGGRFNPTLNSWTTINNLNAPVGRSTHTSVWTGRNMLVWGGKLMYSSNNTNTMGSYYINYFVGGMLNGLVGNQLTIAINEGEQITLVNNGEFFFNQLLLNGDSYNITLVSNPVLPRQTCEITNGMGQISSNDILNIAINCTTNTYSVEGNITGLINGNQLVIHNNLSEELTLYNNGYFKFLTLLEDQQNYEVTIKSPAANPIQPCIINNQSGIIDGENIIDVSINCDIGTDLFFRNGFE
jgi:N-acetylneuraminic acid mutarotase